MCTKVQNFKPISLFLAVQWPRNQVMVMTSLFWNSILGICNCRTTKQMTFLVFWDKTGQYRYVLKIKFRFSKCDLFYLSLTWPKVKCENECHHRILRVKWPKKHVSHDTRAIFLYGDLIWPDLDLDLCLASISYLHDIFVIPSAAFSQSLRLQLSLVWFRQPIRRKESALTFDLWPDLDPTFDLAKKN